MKTVQTVPDALASVNAAQSAPVQFEPGPLHTLVALRHIARELTALRDLAAAVRAALAVPSDADELADAADREARSMAPPVPGVTRVGGYVVRALITTPGRNTAWFVAAEGDSEHSTGRWSTWRAEQDSTGHLLFSCARFFNVRAGLTAADIQADLHNEPETWRPDRPHNRTAALASLAGRAGITPAAE
jgi:hypothetical protein